MKNNPFTPCKDQVNARQIAFCAAFILPMGKLLETPSLLSQYEKGDILAPAFAQFLLQALILSLLLVCASQSKLSILERLQIRLGKWINALYIFFSVYVLFSCILPLLDLEKFVYAAFFDTAPPAFSFIAFFPFLAFVCAKGLKSFGRCADLCLFLFLLPFCALVGMAFFESDFTRLLPFFERSFHDLSQGFTRSTPHFADVALLFPLIASRRYERGDGVKILSGYGIGATLTLLFFAVFFGVFGSIAPREHYAFAKIAQYFPALEVVGRIDLIFVYLLSAVLLFYTCLPLLYASHFTSLIFKTERKTLFAFLLALSAVLFVLFMNRHYDSFYAVISGKLAPVFWLIAYLLPLFCLFIPKNPIKKERIYAR